MAKKIDSVHDLTINDKAYLKGHGITANDFDRMDEQSKKEWKEECEIGSYKESYSRKEAVGTGISMAIPSNYNVKTKKKKQKKECHHQFNTSSNGGIIDICIHCKKNIYQLNI